MTRRKGRLFTILLVGTLGLLLNACAAGNSFLPSPTPPATAQVHPIFREYYLHLGGDAILGIPISPLIQLNDWECQYTQNGLMCRDPLRNDEQSYFLYPLGEKLGVRDDPDNSPQEISPLVVEDYAVFPDFIPIYNLLGAPIVGQPLSRVRYNETLGRYEQYFMNVGFYRSPDEAPGLAHLLPYGKYECRELCQANSGGQGEATPLQTPFAKAVADLGGYEVTGSPIQDPIQTADGYLEQTYENIAIYAPVNDPSEWALRPLPILMGMPSTPPGEKKYDKDQNVLFYPVNGELGYHVPIVFDEFIQNHGGMRFSGNPISESFALPDKYFRQCFENYCLEYHPQDTDRPIVRLSALGKLFLLRQGQRLAPTTDTSSGFQVLASETKPQISAQDTQVIRITIQDGNGQPAVGVQAELTVLRPDGQKSNYTFPPSDADGTASLTLEAAVDLPTGSVINYTACIGTEASRCSSGVYLIWE